MGASLLERDSYLQDTDFEEPTLHTEIYCGCCTQEVEGDEDVALLTIVQAQKVNGKLECYPVLDVDGDFQFPPQFIHLRTCWDDLCDGIRQLASDELPVQDTEILLECYFCKSAIREWEYFAFVQFGEFYVSDRQPTNEKILYTFVEFTNDETYAISHFCVACINRISLEALEDWKDVSQVGECAFCTYARCWRDPSCSCFCHIEQEEK